MTALVIFSIFAGLVAGLAAPLPGDNDPRRFEFDQPQQLANGYAVRLDPPQADGRYRLVLRHPDGQEDLLWNPPGMRYEWTGATTGQTKAVVFDQNLRARISDQQLGVILSIGHKNWFWIRWDMKEKRRLPSIEFLIGSSAATYYLADNNSLDVRNSDGRDFTYGTLTADGEGNLYKAGQLWKEKAYLVYGEGWKRVHTDSIRNHEIIRFESPPGWPFSVGDPDSALGKSHGPSAARRVWPPNRDSDGGASQQSSPPEVTLQLANIPKASGTALGWTMWVLGAALAALAGIAGWIVTSRRRRMDKDSRAGK